MYDLEKNNKIVSVFFSNECMTKIIKKEKHKQIVTKTLYTVSLFICDIFISIMLELNWIGWIVSLCLTFMSSCFYFLQVYIHGLYSLLFQQTNPYEKDYIT